MKRLKGIVAIANADLPPTITFARGICSTCPRGRVGGPAPLLKVSHAHAIKDEEPLWFGFCERCAGVIGASAQGLKS